MFLSRCNYLKQWCFSSSFRKGKVTTSFLFVPSIFVETGILLNTALCKCFLFCFFHVHFKKNICKQLLSITAAASLHYFWALGDSPSPHVILNASVSSLKHLVVLLLTEEDVRFEQVLVERVHASTQTTLLANPLARLDVNYIP